MIPRPSARMALTAAVALALALPLAMPATSVAKHKKPKRPDLTVSSVASPPSTAAAGVGFSVKVTVKNKGKASAGKSTLGLFMGKGSSHKSGDFAVGSKSVGKLKKGKSSKLKVSAKVASAPAGTYSLFACADSKKKVKESKETNNCKQASGKLTIPAPKPPPPPPPPVAAPAISLQHDLEWASARTAASVHVAAGDNVTLRLNITNGVTGRAGYVRTSPGILGPPIGTTSPVSGFVSGPDDGATTVALPFAFRFSGQTYTSVSVGTNGFLSFGGPAAFDRPSLASGYFAGGAPGVTARFFHALFPYWADLDLDPGPAGTGSVTKTVAAGNAAVVFAWSTGFCCVGTTPLRTFDVVLFPDGRIRYDYPGINVVGGNDALVGLSGGSGAATQDIVAFPTQQVPTSSVLYTPRALGAVGAAAAGTATLSLPRASTYVSGDPGCSLALAPTAFRGGSVTCSVAALAAGGGVVKHVTFKAPAGIVPGSVPVPNMSLGATYHTGSATLTDDDEIDGFTASQPALSAPTVTVAYVSPLPNPTATVAMSYSVSVSGGGGMTNPFVTVPIPAHSTFESASPTCGPPSGGVLTCQLDSGYHGTETPLTISVVPDCSLIGSTLTLQATAHAANEPNGTGSVASPIIGPTTC